MNVLKKDLQQSIDDLFEKIEEVIKHNSDNRKNIFDIAGINRRENINSNILQFFLIENEEHGFGSIFFDSLCELIREKGIEVFLDSDYEVIREYKDIDILIASRSSDENQNRDVFDWAVIIEHKIHHQLDNDLRDYWKRVDVKEGGLKVGIVLSPWGQKDQSLLQIYEEEKEGATEPPKHITDYLDLNHKEWMDKVRSKLPEFYLKGDNYNLTVLKDFITNIESMYMSAEERQIKDTQLNISQENSEEIKKILHLDNTVRRYVLEESINVMSGFGYAPKSKYFSARDKHFFKESAEIPDYFRFYFYYPHLVEDGELHLYFELHKTYVKYGERLHLDKELRELIKDKPSAQLKDTSGDDHFHIIHFIDKSFKNFNSENIFPDHLYKIMNDNFFNKQDGLLWKCAERLEIIIAEENKQ